jgi:hypothetical protein
MREKTMADDSLRKTRRTDRPWERHQHFLATRVSAGGTAVPGLLARASRQKRAMLRAQLAAAPAGTAADPVKFWTPVGPSVVAEGTSGALSVSGRITALAVGPGGQRVYAGAANGGVWYSEDGGASWMTVEAYGQPPSTAETLGVEADSLSVGALAVRFGASAASDLIYVGTGEANFSADSYFGIGIKSSTSGGAPIKWNPEATNLVGAAISRIVIDPENPAVVYAATDTGLFVRPQGGDPSIWKRDLQGLPLGKAVTDLVVGGNPGNRLYYAAVLPYAIFQSADASTSPGGGTWLPVGGIPPFVPGTPGTKGRVALAAAYGAQGATPPVIYALLDNGTLFRLDKPSAGPPAPGAPPPDPATLFRPVTGVPRALFADDPPQGDYDIVVAVDPSDPNTVYLAGDAVTNNAWLSFYKGPIAPADGGYKFPFDPANDLTVNPNGTKDTSRVPKDPTWIGQGIHGDGHCLAFPTYADGHQDATTVWVGTDGGLFRSTQSGAQGTFQSRNVGLPVTQMTYIGQRPDTDAVFFGGAQDQGILRFRSEQVCFESPEGDGGGVAVDPNKPDQVMCQVLHAQLYTATDGGNSGEWTNLRAENLFPPIGFRPNNAQQQAAQTESDSTEFSAPIAAIAQDATTTLTVFGTNRPWLTKDWGKNWVTLPSNTNPYDGSAANYLTQDVLSVTGGVTAIAWASSTLLYVATATSVWSFTRAGDNWTKSQLPVTGLPAARSITGIAVEDPARGTFYAVLGGGGTSHVWYFDPDPAINTWVDAGLPGTTLDCPVNTVVVDPDHTDNVYIGSDVGVFQRVIEGGNLSWPVFSTALPECAVTCLSIHPRTRVLRAATHGLGVWEIPLDDAGGDPGVPDIYLRVNSADSGRLSGGVRPSWLDGAPDPTSPGKTLTHAMSPDIKVLRSSAGSLASTPDFLAFASLNNFQTDLATFDKSGTNQVFVEVHNRSVNPIPGDQVRVLLLLAKASGGALPPLPEEFATHINNDDVEPAWLGSSGWTFVDGTNPFRTLPGPLAALTPQVVEFDFKPSGSTSDLYVAAFITTPLDALNATTTDVNVLTMQDKHVALRSLQPGSNWVLVVGAVLVVLGAAALVTIAVTKH